MFVSHRKLYTDCILSLVMFFFSLLHQAIRKAPQQSAIGFRQTAHKFAVVVQLLLGEIPDRATFKEAVLKKPLHPYFQLTQGKHTHVHTHTHTHRYTHTRARTHTCAHCSLVHDVLVWASLSKMLGIWQNLC